MRIPFSQIDAFADRLFAGNPAAVMPLPGWIDEAVLQAIAAENNLSETAFLVADAGDAADFTLRWFTPRAEVALCGHATLAAGHFVLSSDDSRDAVRFATREAGVLEVARADTGYAMALPAWAPTPGDLPGVVAALGVDARETLFHPKGYVLAVVADEAAVRDCSPDLPALAAEGPYVVIVAAPGDESDLVSRVFAPAFGIDEDPVTGSAHAVMVPFWAQRLGRDRFTARQLSARGGRLTCRLNGDHVVLGGGCITVIEGSFLLP